LFLIKMFFGMQKWCLKQQIKMAKALIEANTKAVTKMRKDILTLEDENAELQRKYL
jgi:hypothetical protein